MGAYESVLRQIIRASDRCKEFAEYLDYKIQEEHGSEKGSLMAFVLSNDISSIKELHEAIDKKVSYFFSEKFLEHTYSKKKKA